MKTKHVIAWLTLVLPLTLSLSAQTGSYDISKDKVLYAVGYAHLDTEWNWDYPATINVCLRNMLEENFRLFEKYPEYVFNFTGSRRYRMMKEYYPEYYAKLKDYVRKGRWCVSGSSVDEGEVNISSSESIIRQVLYGNHFFRNEFGKESADYMLPDCFGFLANMPSIWNHCGLLGFSTQKLTWHSASGLPFNVGIWNGPDGKGIIAALNATDYNGSVVPRLDKDNYWAARLDGNQKKYGFSFDYRYYGVGDEGGAPRPNDVKNVVGSLNNPDSKFKVILTSSDQMYKDITPDVRRKLPVYSGDLLLIQHSAGSLTSNAFMKRTNRKNELLAQASEQAASFADFMGGTAYPYDKLNASWDLVLGSQFHDILPGTSIPKAYEYAWNDEFVAANGFSEVLKNSLKQISGKLNTNVQGRALVVYNPVAMEREDVVTATMTFATSPENITVYDFSGKPLQTQVFERNGNNLKFIFLAKLPSAGLQVFDVREGGNGQSKMGLSVGDHSLENGFYRIKIAANGDIESIFDKKLSRELLSQPAQLEMLREKPEEWPSWNMDWKDRLQQPVGLMNNNATVSILENGPVRVSLLIKRDGMNSSVEQVISLAAGQAGRRIEVANKVDWQSKEVSLKASFPLTVANKVATYNLGVGTLKRSSNDSLKYEVPSKEWFDLTDNSGKFGVTVLEDCKYGSDKPNDNTLRLTLLYTPGISDAFRWCSYQSTQDWGIHEMKYGIYSHKGDWVAGLSAWQGKFLNQPPIAFETGKHNGSLGDRVSLIKSNTPQVGVMAFKKMEDGDYYIVRVNELFGKDAQSVELAFPAKIADAYEVNGQEKRIGSAVIKNGSLNFDISHYTIKSFAVKLEALKGKEIVPEQKELDLPYSTDKFSYDENRHDCNESDNWSRSYPAELVPKVLVSEGIAFKMGNLTDENINTVEANGQQIDIPEGNYTRMYILAAANDDTRADFRIDNQSNELLIQGWSGFIGQFYKRIFNCNDYSSVKAIANPYLKESNIAWFASHTHSAYPTANNAYEYCYIYKYELNIPKGAKYLTLPRNRNIKVFAVTLTKGEPDDITLATPLFDDFHQVKAAQLR